MVFFGEAEVGDMLMKFRNRENTEDQRSKDHVNAPSPLEWRASHKTQEPEKLSAQPRQAAMTQLTLWPQSGTFSV